MVEARSNNVSHIRGIFGGFLPPPLCFQVDINDLPPEAIEDMISVCYLDELKKKKRPPEHLMAILQAGEKYELEKLKSLAEEELTDSVLEPSSACVLLDAALKGRSEKLRKDCIAMIKENFQDISTSQEFADLMKQYPTAFLENDD